MASVRAYRSSKTELFRVSVRFEEVAKFKKLKRLQVLKAEFLIETLKLRRFRQILNVAIIYRLKSFKYLNWVLIT